MSAPILVINTGSSSLKLGVFEERDGDEQGSFDAQVDDVGKEQGSLRVRDASGASLREAKIAARDHAEAFAAARSLLEGVAGREFSAVGHRVVHGGAKLVEHQRITPQVVEALRAALHFAPLHIPSALAMIEAAERAYGNTPQFACFDTAFHRTLPPEAAHFALPRELWAEGIRRFGFHGLSCEAVVHGFGSKVPERMVVAHLGSGASLTAIRAGASVDTSMGLTPTGGIVMSSRTGDLDPGVIVFLLRTQRLDADALERLVNRESGLVALAGEPGMKEIEQRAQANETDAMLAVEVFCRTIAKFVAGYASVLGGLDTLVFTGGIGEHSDAVRQNVLRRLEWMRPFEARVVVAEEDRQIARHCRRLLRG